MKRTQVAVLAACIPAFAAVMVTAQGQPETKTAQAQQGKSITVTGCLQGPGPAGTAGQTPSATTASGASGQFVLMHATMGAASTATGGAGSVPGNTGTTGTTPAGTPPATSPRAEAGAASNAGARGSEMSYVLEGSRDELARHVGHRVEVTGTTESAMPKTGGASAGASGQSNSAGAGSAAGQAEAGASSPNARDSQHADGKDSQRLHVTSVRMISSSCPQ